MPSIINRFKVVSNKKLCPRFFQLSLDAKSLIHHFKPGQFINIRVSDSFEPLFRRPFSIYRGKSTIDILYEVVGKGTDILAKKRAGEDLDILGPLGTYFHHPPKATRQVVMIAGGIGIAPFLALTDELKKKKFEIILLYGGRTRGHVYNMKEFKKNGCKVFIATDDGSVGVKGRVSNLFSKITANPKTTYLYTCGPHAMLAAVQKFALQHKLEGEASCESVMGCGIGSCLGCVVSTQDGYKTVCYEGSVFKLKEVIFSA